MTRRGKAELLPEFDKNIGDRTYINDSPLFDELRTQCALYVGTSNLSACSIVKNKQIGGFAMAQATFSVRMDESLKNSLIFYARNLA